MKIPLELYEPLKGLELVMLAEVVTLDESAFLEFFGTVLKEKNPSILRVAAKAGAAAALLDRFQEIFSARTGALPTHPNESMAPLLVMVLEILQN